MMGWHFVGDTLRDGRPVPADGEWLVHDGPVVPCFSGLHASTRIIDALKYARGPTICRVELRGDLLAHGDPIDKHAGRERRILWRVDADAILREFARRCALDVIHLWDAPDVVEQYLKTGDPSLRQASREASFAASVKARWAANRKGSWEASREASKVAILAASRAASWAAGWEAGWEASNAASWAAGWEASNAASWAASNAVSKVASWEASLASANRRLTAMVSAKKEG